MKPNYKWIFFLCRALCSSHIIAVINLHERLMEMWGPEHTSNKAKIKDSGELIALCVLKSSSVPYSITIERKVKKFIYL